MSRPPFFVVGCGRSGTTLLRVILNRHSEVAVPLESLFMVDYLRAGSDVPIETMRSLIVNEYELREWSLTLEPGDLADCDNAVDLIEDLHARYAEKHGKVLWGQKTPRFVRHWQLLKSAFPEARFVHVIRDPRAVANSLMRSDVHRSTAYHGVSRWINDVSSGVEMEGRLGADAMRVRYEDLVESPEVSVRAICRFLGLEFEEPMLVSETDGGEEYDEYYANIHSLVSDPVTAIRTEAWRQELSHNDLEIVEGLAGGLMTDLGYPPSLADSRVGPVDHAVAAIHRFARLPGQALHYRRFRKGYLTGVLARKRALGTLSFADFGIINR